MKVNWQTLKITFQVALIVTPFVAAAFLWGYEQGYSEGFWRAIRLVVFGH